ncbi:MAG: hypothetical protein WBD55_13655 [Dehalococcoidia bacterium]
MVLVAGDRLGPYEVERLLGSGGMGEVYQGLDTRLGRAVALKVISQRLVGDAACDRTRGTDAGIFRGICSNGNSTLRSSYPGKRRFGANHVNCAVEVAEYRGGAERLRAAVGVTIRLAASAS